MKRNKNLAFALFAFAALTFTSGAALASWWYNNSFTQAAIKADEEFERQKKRV